MATLTSTDLEYLPESAQFRLSATWRTTSGGLVYSDKERIFNPTTGASVLINPDGTSGGSSLEISAEKSYEILQMMINCATPYDLSYESNDTGANLQTGTITAADSFNDNFRYATLSNSSINPADFAVKILQKTSDNKDTALSYISDNGLTRVNLSLSDYEALTKNNMYTNSTSVCWVEKIVSSSTGIFNDTRVFFGDQTTDLGDLTLLMCPGAVTGLTQTQASPEGLILKWDVPISSQIAGNASQYDGLIRVVKKGNTQTYASVDLSKAQVDGGTFKLVNSGASGSGEADLGAGFLTEGTEVNIYHNLQNSVCTGPAADLLDVKITNAINNLTLAQVSVTQDMYGNYSNVSVQASTTDTNNTNPIIKSYLKRTSDGVIIKSLTQNGDVAVGGAITFPLTQFSSVQEGNYVILVEAYDGTLAGASATSDSFNTYNALPTASVSVRRKVNSSGYNQYEFVVDPLDPKYGIAMKQSLGSTAPADPTAASSDYNFSFTSQVPRVIQGSTNLANESGDSVVRVKSIVYLLSDTSIVSEVILSDDSYVYLKDQLGAPTAPGSGVVDSFNYEPSGQKTITYTIVAAAGAGAPDAPVLPLFRISDPFTGSEVMTTSATTFTLPALGDSTSTRSYKVTEDGYFENADESQSVNEDPAKISNALDLPAKWSAGPTPIQEFAVTFNRYSYTSDVNINNSFEFTLPDNSPIYSVDTSSNSSTYEWVGSKGHIVGLTQFTPSAAGKQSGRNPVDSFNDGESYSLRVNLAIKDTGSNVILVPSQSPFGPVKCSAPTFVSPPNEIVFNAPKNGGYVDVATLGSVSAVLTLYLIRTDGGCQEIQINAVVGRNYFTSSSTLNGAVAILSNECGMASVYKSA